MSEIKVWFALRDLTIDKDINIVLPKENLEDKLNTDHEYLICDSDLDISEYKNIFSINKDLLKWKEQGMDMNTLSIFNETYLFNEIEECFNNDTYLIVDTSEADDWCMSQEEKNGYLLFKNGYVTLPFDYVEEMESYIDWFYIWRTANCNGWRDVIYDGTTYLVKDERRIVEC